jgi:translocation and assembly module TamB
MQSRIPASSIQRLGRIAIIAAAIVAGLLCLAILLPALPPVRDRILTFAIGQARARLPGSLQVARADWSAPGRLEFAGLLWTAEGDTLAAADTLAVEVDLTDLLLRDLHVRRVHASGVVLDLPRLRAAFPSGSTSPTPESKDDRGRFFPRRGALPGLPSIALDDVRMEAARCRLSESIVLLDISVVGSGDATAGGSPRLAITGAGARSPDGAWSLSVRDLVLDGSTGRVSGSATASLDTLGQADVEFATENDGAVSLEATYGPRAAPTRDRARITVTGNPVRDGIRVRSIAFRGSASLPGTRTLGGWAGPFRQAGTLAELDGVVLDFEGDILLQPKFSARVAVRAEPTGWIEACRGSFAYADRGLRMDSLLVEVPGARLFAAGERNDDRLSLDADLRVEDGRWIGFLRPGASIPERLTAVASLSMRGDPRSPTVTAALDGSLRRGGLVVEDATLQAEFPRGTRETGSFQVRTRLRDFTLETRGETALVFPLEARLDPIRVTGTAETRTVGTATPGTTTAGTGTVEIATAGTGVRGGNDARPGILRFDPGTSSLALEGVRVVGDLGEGTIAADLREGRGPFQCSWIWPEMPGLLAPRLTRSSAVRDSLDARWREDGPFEWTVNGSLAGTTEMRVELAGSFALPGPRTLSSLLPREARVEDLGSIRGSMAARLRTSPSGATWSAEVDLSPSGWISGAPIRVAGDSRGFSADSLRLDADGLGLAFDGGRGLGGWNARGELRLEDTRLLRRLLPQVAAEDSVRLLAGILLRGSDPDFAATLKGGGCIRGISAPEIEGRASRTQGRWEVSFNTLSGLSTPGVALDRLAVAAAGLGQGPGLFPARVSVEVRGRGMSVVHRVRIDRENGWDILADTLGIEVGGRKLASQGPFRIRWIEDPSRLEIRDVALAGSLGSLRASGTVFGADMELEAALRLDLAGVPRPRSIPAGLWPSEARVTLGGDPTYPLRLDAVLSGLDLGDGRDRRARIQVAADSAGFSAHVVIEDSLAACVEGRAVAPATWSFIPPALRLDTRGLSGELRLVEVPLPWELLGRTGSKLPPPGRVSGRASSAVIAGGPVAQAEFQVTILPNGNGGRPLRMDARAAWVQSGAQRSWLAEETGGIPPSLDAVLERLLGPGIAGTATVSFSGEPRLTAALALPIRPVREGMARVDSTRTMLLEAHARDFDLTDVAAFLPPDTKLSGFLDADVAARGAPGAPQLSGTFAARKLQFESGSDLRAAGKAEFRLAGDVRRPVLEGSIEILSALLSVPEPPRRLHPTHGPSMLWEASGKNVAATDSAATEAAIRKGGRPSRPASPSIRPEMNVEIRVPSGAWVRGRNLDVELAGTLRVRQLEGLPTVVGDLEAKQGTLTFLGRSFALDRGRIQFFGEDEANPSLDVTLSTKVSSTTVTVTVTGKAREPEIELSSDPQMSEADIMSLLVLGRPADELDGDQAQLVAQRARAMAATYGASELEKNLAGPLGVDVLSLNPSGGSTGESSVVVGKYLSPRALLKYEQALDSAAGFFVSLEYTLTRGLALVTLAGTQQSGAEISWSRDY